MWKLANLIDSARADLTKVNGNWVPARPLSIGGLWGLKIRMYCAWRVLTGSAEAFEWPEGQ